MGMPWHMPGERGGDCLPAAIEFPGAGAVPSLVRMNPVKIYTKATCPYCIRAKQLLDMKGVSYEEIRIDAEPARRSEMIAAANGRTTVPQIFIAGRHVGGCDDLYALDDSGRLDQMLGLGVQPGV